MPSFDATLEADETEVRNAIDQTNKAVSYTHLTLPTKA